MKKIRASLWRLVLVLGLVLMGAQAAGAYEFTYLGSGIVASAQVPGDGPYTNFGSLYDELYVGADAFGSNMNAQGFGERSSNAPNSIKVEVRGITEVYSPGSSGSAYGSAVTKDQDPSVTTGIYFRLDGGLVGPEVQINYFWSANISNLDGGMATLGGGSTDMYISVNGTPVWEKAEISRYSNESEGFSESSIFWAHVGDIIGINLSASADVDFLETGDFYSFASNSIQLDAVPLPPAALLLGSGLLGLLALRGFRPRRR